ncbi:hypothetical protein I3400192H8_19610 [Dialister sp. i34-0019-2H8]
MSVLSTPPDMATTTFFFSVIKIGILSAGRAATARDGKNIHSFLVPTIPKTIIPGVSPENLIGVKVRRIVLL